MVADGSVGPGPGDRAGVFDGELPAVFVDSLMPGRTQRHEILQIGTAAVFPERDVVGVALIGRDLAADLDTGPVLGGECVPLRFARQSA